MPETPIEALRPHLAARQFKPLAMTGWGGAQGFTTVEQVEAASDLDLLDVRLIGMSTLRAIRAATARVRNTPPPAHVPMRGSDVEAWIKRARDEYRGPDDPDGRTPSWDVLDNLLDDYQLHADVGASLDVPAEDIGPRAPGEV